MKAHKIEKWFSNNIVYVSKIWQWLYDKVWGRMLLKRKPVKFWRPLIIPWPLHLKACNTFKKAVSTKVVLQYLTGSIFFLFNNSQKQNKCFHLWYYHFFYQKANFMLDPQKKKVTSWIIHLTKAFFTVIMYWEPSYS